MSFAYPLALMWPVIFIFWYQLNRTKRVLPICTDSQRLLTLPVSLRQRLRAPIVWLLQLAALALLCMAALRPQDITIVKNSEQSRNLMLVVDVSESMATRDFQFDDQDISRMEAIRVVVSEFIEARGQDRIGLAIFGERAFLQSPLTLDHAILVQLVKSLEAGMVGPATAIGDGLGVALKRLEPVKEGSKAIILLTDGVSNSGTVKPVQAAQVAKDLGIKIHTIGIGTTSQIKPSGLSGMLSGILGSQGNKAEFDEATLKEIAAVTNGVYFNAENLERLKAVYNEIDALERSEQEEQTKSIVHEHFAKYASFALAALAVLFILSSTIFQRYP